MFLLKHISPEQAEGVMAEVYGMFPPGVPVPDPLQIMSASPGLAKCQSGIIRYFMEHDTLDFAFFACLRFILSCEIGYTYCREFNAQLLKRAGGMSDEQLEAMRVDPGTAPLDKAQRALLRFALKAVRTPAEVTAAEVEALRDLGFNDRDIFDAAYHGASMLGPATLYKALVR